MRRQIAETKSLHSAHNLNAPAFANIKRSIDEIESAAVALDKLADKIEAAEWITLNTCYPCGCKTIEDHVLAGGDGHDERAKQAARDMADDASGGIEG